MVKDKFELIWYAIVKSNEQITSDKYMLIRI